MRAEAGRLYAAIAAEARQPDFYAAFGVPDTVDGRFEMLCVHAHAVFHRLRGQGAQAEQLAQALYDSMFQDLDAALRELGAADIGVGRRIKIMTEALRGRIEAYDAALAMAAPAAEDALRGAIARNVYGTVTPDAAQVAAMARYLRALRKDLAGVSLADLAQGRVAFPARSGPMSSGEAADASS